MIARDGTPPVDEGGGLVRLLHTSDWHLGRPLLTASLVEHQAEFLGWLAQVCAEREVEAVLVSGDVYDRAIPSLEAVALFERALGSLARQCPLVLISGNHDSPTRLAIGGRLLESVDVHFRSELDDIARPVELTGADGTAVLVYGVPYLEPERARGPLGSEKSHAAVLTAAMDLVRADLSGRRAVAADAGAPEPRAVVMSHSFITGGEPSESERDISVGGAFDAPVSLFAGVDYVALGHLHGPQRITAPESPVVRYSGSPLAYSFSERAQRKSVTIVDIDAAGVVEAEIVPVPVPRPLSTLVGELSDLLEDPAHESAVEHWVQAILTDSARPENAMDRLRARFPHAVDLKWERHVDGVPAGDAQLRLDPATASPIEVVGAFIEYVTQVPPTEAELALADEAVQLLRLAEVDA